jgi:putative protease
MNLSSLFTYSIDRSVDIDSFIISLEHKSVAQSLKEKIEVILHSKGFSRIGRMELSDCLEGAKKLNAAGIKCYFQWDILMVESVFVPTCALFKQIDFEVFNGVRIQDPGALNFLKSEGFSKEVHFITDQGNHNKLGLQKWIDFWKEGVSRLVISPEIPAKEILRLQGELDIELEVLGAGSILLFYTPRHLVSPLYGEEEQSTPKTIEQSLVWGKSEESPHKGFPIVENQHGTFMFNTKEVLIFDEVEELGRLIQTRAVVFRIDYLLEPLLEDGLVALLSLLSDTVEERLKLGADAKLAWKAFAEKYRSLGMTKGFFRTNKTDVLFKKLKSTRLQSERDDLIGEVVDVKKKKHIGIRLSSCDSPLKLGESIELTSPEGNIRQTSLVSMRNADGDEVEVANKDQIIFIPHIGGISVKTTVCRLLEN